MSKYLHSDIEGFKVCVKKTASQANKLMLIICLVLMNRNTL